MVERKREGAQFEEAYQARDIDQAIKGAYPILPYVGTSANPSRTQTTPTGIWRIINTACVRPSANGQLCLIQILREGVYYDLSSSGFVPVAANGSSSANLLNPITLKPGDELVGRDQNALGNVLLTMWYIDVPIPGAEMPYFKPGKRG